MQKPTVLIRVYGETRDKLDALRQPGSYSWSRRESLADVVARLVERTADKLRTVRRKTR